MDEPSPSPPSSRPLAWVLVFLLTGLLILAGIFIFYLLFRKSPSPSGAVALPGQFSLTASPTAMPTPTPADRILNLDKSYQFPILAGGRSVGEVDLAVQSVRRTTTVDIAGGTATTPPGRVLVIVDVELTNPGNIAASVNVQDYLRLRVNGSEKLIAPDYHPDPIDLRPQSTKSVRLGFLIASGDSQIVLQVGELTGTKDQLPLEF